LRKTREPNAMIDVNEDVCGTQITVEKTVAVQAAEGR
jgi:hypothetical protein